MAKRPPLPQMLRRRHPFIAAMANRPVSLLVLIIATMCIGLLVTVPLPGITVDRMELALLPKGFESRDVRIEIPLRSSQTNLSPRQIEEDITLPVEGELATIPGIESLTAESSRNSSEFRISFAPGTNLNDALAQVNDRLERAKKHITTDIGQISRRRWSGTSMPIAWLNVRFDPSVEDPFDKVRQRILPALESVEGVSDVSIRGDLSFYYRVALKEDKMANYNVRDLIQKLQNENFTLPVGRLDSGGVNTFYVFDSRFTSLEDLRDYPVNTTMVLSDVADVYEARSSSSMVFSYGWEGDELGFTGGQGVFLTVSKNSDANTVTTSQELEAAMQALREDPTLKGVSYQSAFNQGEEIVSQILILLETVALGGMLAVLVLLLFLKRARLALIIALSIPLSMTMALIVMYFMGEILSSFALMGFTIVAGMLLDNAIVVSENIYRRMSIDRNARFAAVAGAGEVGMALTLATSTTIIVFFSLAITGEAEMLPMLKALGYPICFSLIFSIFVALAVIPYTMGTVFDNSPERFDPRAAYLRFYRRVAKVPLLGVLLTYPLRLLFGRPPEVEAWTGAGDWIDRRPRRRRILVGSSIVLGLLAAFGAAYFAFYHFGGEEFWKPLADKLAPAAEEESGARRWMSMGESGPGPHPSLMAIMAFLGVGALPFMILAMLPRRTQAHEPSPLVARVAEVYGSLVGYLTRHVAIATTITLLFMGSSVYLGFTFLKSTKQNRGNDGRVRMWVQFPANLDADVGNTERNTPDANYFLKTREALFGVRADGQVDKDLQKAAFEKFGIEMGSITWTATGMEMQMRLDPSRSEEFSDLDKKIKAALPKMADFRSSGGFDMSEMNKIRIQLKGPEFGRLIGIAEALRGQLEAYPGLDNVEDGSENRGYSEAALMIDRGRAKAFGVTPESIAQLISFQLNGTQAPDFRDGDIVRPIRIIRDAPESRTGVQRDPTYEDVKNIEVFGGGGGVPVSAIAEDQLSALGASRPIQRIDQQTTLTITANPVGRSEEIKTAVQGMLDELDLPEGYSADIEEGSDGQRRGGRRGRRFGGGDSMQMVIGVFAAAGLILLVMGLLFESLILPVVVLIACVPGAIAGAWWALILTDTTMDELCFLGMLILVGVSVNNGIVLVDLVQRLRKEGLEVGSALKEACTLRMRPVLMTSITTCAGLLPMAMGDQRFFGSPYYPLGRTILGGILFSTIVTLVALPVLYLVFDACAAYTRNTFGLFFGKRKGQA